MKPRTRILLLALLALVLSALIARGTLQAFAGSADEHAYLFQAETFEAGRLWNPAHEERKFFSVTHVATKDGKWFSRFPPGWPLVLALGLLLEIPAWLVNPLLAALSVGVFHALGRRLYDDRVATLATTAWILSAFFLFNSASFFSHTFCALLILGFTLFARRFADGAGYRTALLAGLCIGVAFTTRYYTALLCAAPLGIAILWRRDRRSLVGLGLIFAGALPSILALLVYNYLFSFNPFLPVSSWVDPEEGLGFVKGHTLLRGLRYTWLHLDHFVRWTAPPLIFLYAPLWIHGLWRRRLRWEDFVFPALVVGHVFYWTAGGNQFGPRFYYEGYPLVVLFVTGALLHDKGLPTPRLRRTRVTIWAVGLLSGVLLLVPIARREHTVVEERMDLLHRVEEADLRNAVVVVFSSTGVMRGLPARDLTRNGIDLDGEVLYVRNRQEKNRELPTLFPERTIYRYTREAGRVEGRLERWQPE